MFKKLLIGTSVILTSSLITFSLSPSLAFPIETSQRLKQTQTDFSDEELKALVKDFVEIIPDLQAVIIESNEEIATIIGNEGLTEERFYQILRGSDNQDVTPQEQQKFQTIKTKIVPIQQQSLFAMYEVVNEKSGLTMAEMEAIVAKVQEDVALQEELRELIVQVIVEQNSIN